MQKVFIFANVKHVHNLIMSKNTKNMLNKDKKMKVRDKQTLDRFENVVKGSEVLRKFFEKGFKSVSALHAVVYSFYPETTYMDILNFWNFRKCSEEMVEKLNIVLEKLNYE